MQRERDQRVGLESAGFPAGSSLFLTTSWLGYVHSVTKEKLNCKEKILYIRTLELLCGPQLGWSQSINFTSGQ